MKKIDSRRAASAALLLAAVFAASPSPALWPFTQSETVKKDKIVERSNKEFGQLIENVEKNDKLQADAKTLALNHIRTTQERFNARAIELRKPEYAGWEFDLLGEQVSKVIVPTIRDAVRGAAAMPLANQTQALADAVNDNEGRNEQVLSAFFATRRSDIGRWAKQNGLTQDPSASHELGNALSQDGHTAVGSDTTDNGTSGHAAGGLGGALGENTPRGHRRLPDDPGKWNPSQIEWAIRQSEVVQLGLSIANDVAHPKPPAPTPDPVTPGTGGGVVPTPNPGGGGTSPNSGGGTQTGGGNQGGSSGSGGAPASIGDIIRTIASPSGVSQLYASAGVSSLQSRDFRKAFELAGRALALDPGNRNALEVLNAAKGRTEGVQAGDVSWTAAKGAAASLGGGPGDAGAFPSAAPAPGIAAAALSGAAKVASDQARAGAINALKLGDPEGALVILTKALAENPANPALLNLRAQTYGRVGRWEEALKDANAGLALAPGNAILLTTKALSENRTRRWRDALATSEALIAAEPNNAWAFANRAHAYAGLGNRDAMLADINRAAALDPRFREAAESAARLQLPSDGDVMFLFPGEAAKAASPASAPPAGRGRSFGVVVGAGLAGGLLLALGLLSTVLSPLKNTVVSAFTRVKRAGPATTQAVATAEPASVAGHVGGMIRGQYEISRQIGAGGMGMVYEGTDRSLGRRVAIKKMREELRLNARERDRFIIEAKTVASLHHPNIVDIYAIAEEGDDVYLVFEYVDGKTVHDLVQSQGRLAPADALGVARAMGEALTYAHAHGVIHRDMKPSNVMRTADGRIKVMDFGIARMAKDAMTRYSMTNTVVGTPPYMAPEQEQGVVRKESDVYALAVCAYEMLTGKLPFIGIGAGMLMNKINMSYIPPSRAIAGLPEALDEVFLKAFQADPDRRHRTPAEFVAALQAAAESVRGRPA